MAANNADPRRRRIARFWTLLLLWAGLLLAVIGVFLLYDDVSDRQTAQPTLTPIIITRVAPQVIVNTPAVTEAPASQPSHLPVIFDSHTSAPCDPFAGLQGGTLNGQPTKWQPLTLSFNGPAADEAGDAPNPFLDYRLQVVFVGPSGQFYDVPGFFAGDGNGGGIGDVWQARFAADEPGEWHYCASFRAGPEVAVSLDPLAGEPAAFDGAAGRFIIGEIDSDAQGFYRWGRLGYVGGHYLKFRDGPYFIKSGTDSPENFLGYLGFDNTVDQGGTFDGFLHQYAPHVADWQPGDPNFVGTESGYDAKGIIGALNYLSDRGVNSIYFLPMNLGGDGQDTYPFLSPGGSPAENLHYDISKLEQWNIVLDHAQRSEVSLHIVLNEAETTNHNWLDAGALGTARKLFYRELIARFAYLPAIKWNLSEENTFPPDRLREFADYIGAMDWADHPIAVHTPSNDPSIYEALLGDERFTTTSFQYSPDLAEEYVEAWRAASANSGLPWVIDMDENNPAQVGLHPDTAADLRRRVLYDVYFSGGNVEWYGGYHNLPVGGDTNMEDFRTREAMWDYMRYARRFMEENLPFWEMNPADEILTGESEAFGGGEVFALPGVVYAVYLPEAAPAGLLAVPEPGKSYLLRWYNPRAGEFVGEPQTLTADAFGLALGLPPTEPTADWVALITAVDLTPTPTTAPYP